MNTGKWLIVFALLILWIGISATQSLALVPVRTTGNNFTMLQPDGTVQGGTNDVLFTWDGTLKTAVAASNQVANASISSSCPFSGVVWTTHDVAVYGPGVYTIKASCPARSPGCATGSNPVTFTVGANQVGAHILFNYGTAVNIDIVNVWTKNSAFTPSTMWTGACGSNAVGKVWDLMSSDPDGDGINGRPMVDGPFIGVSANFNMMGVPHPGCVDTAGNNFTMNQPDGSLGGGGTNDVRFTWSGTMKTSVAVSGQCPNATLSSYCPFSSFLWFAHDFAIYGPGTYTIYSDCPAGSPGCGVGAPISFTVGAGQIGGHMLFDWGSAGQPTPCGQTNCAIDVVNVWTPKATYSTLPCDAPLGDLGCMYTGACGSNSDTKVWDWASSDFDRDGIPGTPMVDGPFLGFNGNFNMMGTVPAGGCAGFFSDCGLNCNDNDPCTTDDIIDQFFCIHTPVVCNDNNACTTDTCNSATGCVFTPISCDDNNICTSDSCDPVLGCQHAAVVPSLCNDNNACTTDTCDPATGCVFTPIVCNDNDACTTDTCNTATGCVFTPIVCNDNNACTIDTCDATTGACSHTPTAVCIDTANNNFTTIDVGGTTYGGTNDVRFTSDGTLKTSVAASGQVSNATLSSPCLFLGLTWKAHDVTIYGPGTYTVYVDCPAGNPGCGGYGPVTFTVGPNEIGGHMLFDWNVTTNFDVVDVWQPKAVFGPSEMWTGACGANPADKVWDWMSKDVDGDGINGIHVEEGCSFDCPSLNFNLMGTVNCDDGNACTDDAWNSTNNPADVCVHTIRNCNDNNACTTESCDPATGCVFTPIVCNDNDACTTDTCNTATGCVFTPIVCSDNNQCTVDTCNPATGCVFTPTFCYDDDICTADSCNPATGCEFVPILPALCNDDNACTTDGCAFNACTHVTVNCNDNNACTADSCDPAKGCVHTPINCNDNNICTTDTCDPATGCGHTPSANCCNTAADCGDNNACTRDTCVNNACVHTPIFCCDACESPNTCNPLYGCPLTIVCWPSCNDNNACTIDTCNTATGCVFTPVNCNDNNACTIDTCDPVKGCVHTPIVCNDNDLCTTDTCNPATGCVFTPKVCPMPDVVGVCYGDISLCDPATGLCRIPQPIDCNDHNACTIDTCDPAIGVCVHTPVNCDDRNCETIDTCDPAIGCIHIPIDCNDNNLCTTDMFDCANKICIHVPINCDDGNACTNDTCDPATGLCLFAFKCAAGETCDPAVGTCVPTCDIPYVLLAGGGQNPATVDKEIQTSFTVQSGTGCIIDYTKSSVTCIPGTIMYVNVKTGTGPQPTSATWNGAPIPTDTEFTIECPTVSGASGKLVLDNKASGGSDVDRITIKAQ